MLPIPMPYRIAIAASGVVLVAAFGFSAGYSKASDKYAPKVAQLEAAIVTAEQLAKESKLEHERVNDELKKTNDDTLAAIGSYYDGVLQAERKARATAGGKQGPAPTPCEQRVVGHGTITGCPADIERRCALDAARVEACASFFIGHKFPTQ